MLFRLVKAGVALCYQPRALVRHSHRRRMDELHAQMRDTGIGFSAALARAAAVYPEERAAIGRLWAWWAAKLFYRSLKANGVPAAALRALARTELEGVTAGVGRYRRGRPPRPPRAF
jgi:hypothetical protein